jgi:hypothetical protein
MAGPRINQFADDLGVSRSVAQKLMKKARGRKDGGSETLEKHMSNKYKGPLPKTRSGKDDTEYNMRFKEARAAHLRKKQKEEMEAEGRKYGGVKHMACGGYGKAIQGTKFTGVK